MQFASYAWSANDIIYSWKVKTKQNYLTKEAQFLFCQFRQQGEKISLFLTEWIYFHCSARTQSSLCQTFSCLADSSSLNTLIARWLFVFVFVFVKIVFFLLCPKFRNTTKNIWKSSTFSPALNVYFLPFPPALNVYYTFSFSPLI